MPFARAPLLAYIMQKLRYAALTCSLLDQHDNKTTLMETHTMHAGTVFTRLD